jgi:putative ABC transport system permease protein
MTFNDMFHEAKLSLTAYLFRTMLTMLGIIIGICAVVMMVTAGQTVQKIIHDEMSTLSNLIIITPNKSNLSASSHLGAAKNLTTADTQAINRLVGIKAVAPVIMDAPQIVYANNNWQANVYGTTADYLAATDLHIATGRAFDERDLRSGRNVILIGKTLVQQLFNGKDPIGQTLRIRNFPFQVIGVLSEKGQNIAGFDEDSIVIMPITTARQKIMGWRAADSVDYMFASTDEEADIKRIEQQIKTVLREQHRIRPGQEDDFTVNNLVSFVGTVETVGYILSILLAIIASISLLVGSIGIMNMMLVSVNERVREIGLRKAIGATQRSIMLQFLLETVLISLVGCLLGAVLGIGLCFLAGMILQKTIVLSILSVITPFVIALLVGISAGLFPAMKAARLDPIKALTAVN